jgi:hypothetical protein
VDDRGVDDLGPATAQQLRLLVGPPVSGDGDGPPSEGQQAGAP